MVTIGILGGGVMATALMTGIIKGGVSPSNITITDINQPKLDSLAKTFPGLKTSTKNADAINGKDVILICVKPQMAPKAIPPIVDLVQPNQLILSVMAGYDLAGLKALFKGRGKYVRVMPNTPAVTGMGATVFCPGPNVTEAEAAVAEKILSSVGYCANIDESMFNAATGVSGCGPAFVFLFIEAMADAGVRRGLPRPIALKLAAQTVMGSGAMVVQTGQHPGVLKDGVCSPGGVTICGVNALEGAGLRGAVISGVDAAVVRAEEMIAKSKL
eukprot:PhM_4_TR2028/c0_g1_i1/m.91154/K00286/proC; pyrroline-5-carboxylate reductase